LRKTVDRGRICRDAKSQGVDRTVREGLVGDTRFGSGCMCIRAFVQATEWNKTHSGGGLRLMHARIWRTIFFSNVAEYSILPHPRQFQRVSPSVLPTLPSTPLPPPTLEPANVAMVIAIAHTQAHTHTYTHNPPHPYHTRAKPQHSNTPSTPLTHANVSNCLQQPSPFPVPTATRCGVWGGEASRGISFRFSSDKVHVSFG
jgi:hypothetical protein